MPVCWLEHRTAALGSVDHHCLSFLSPPSADYQRRMVAARKANNLRTWIGFARWYGQLRKRAVVPA